MMYWKRKQKYASPDFLLANVSNILLKLICHIKSGYKVRVLKLIWQS
jgi:hypothetical protein